MGIESESTTPSMKKANGEDIPERLYDLVKILVSKEARITSVKPLVLTVGDGSGSGGARSTVGGVTIICKNGFTSQSGDLLRIGTFSGFSGSVRVSLLKDSKAVREAQKIANDILQTRG